MFRIDSKELAAAVLILGGAATSIYTYKAINDPEREVARLAAAVPGFMVNSYEDTTLDRALRKEFLSGEKFPIIDGEVTVLPGAQRLRTFVSSNDPRNEFDSTFYPRNVIKPQGELTERVVRPWLATDYSNGNEWIVYQSMSLGRLVALELTDMNKTFITPSSRIPEKLLEVHPATSLDLIPQGISAFYSKGSFGEPVPMMYGQSVVGS